MVDFKLTTDKKATVKEINEMFKDAAACASVCANLSLNRFCAYPYSAIVDLTGT
ncbi:glyceraldehyde 3-phosphate dehydrogenase, partial [Wolbachia endosymbiont of Drosophila ananassae]